MLNPMDARTLQARAREALRLHKAGRFDQAQELYEAILHHAPRNAPARHGLGMLLHAAGEPAHALPHLVAAVRERPGSAIYHNNLGNTLRALGQAADAEAAYRASLRLDPDYALAAYNLGALQLDGGDGNAAQRSFAAALAKCPGQVAAAQALSDLLIREEKPAEAEACLRDALGASPDQPDLLFLLGTLMRHQGRVDDAIACHERVVALQPDHGAVFNDLGALYQLRGRVELAIASFDRALELDPESGEAHFNRGKLLADLARFDDAAESFERAIALTPRLATEAACHLAVVRRHLCDWQEEAARTADLVRRIEETLRTQPARGLPPLTLNVLPVPAELRLAVARHLGRGLEQQTSATRARCGFRPAARREPERLRVGYVSPDFRTHAVGTLVHDLFRHHDRSAVSVNAYSLVNVDDPFQRHVREGVDAFVDVSRESPEAIARRIHADGIDVLVDLAGYTTYSRTAIFALRPAPVQVHWLGYLDTMGANFLPYILADDRVIPEQATSHFSETIVSLPDCFAVASELPIADPPSREELGLPQDAFVFCCMNGLHKLDAQTFDSWMRILLEVPEGVLWLPDEGAERARANLVAFAQARGVDGSRLHFASRAPLPHYLARYRVADLFLDTFAYNGGATAVGALRAGLPILTKPGRTFMSRMGASLSAAAGLPDMVCEDAARYEARAIELATEPGALARVREQLGASQHSAPLFDVARFARQLEGAYQSIWRHHHDRDPARRIRVGSAA